METDEIIIELSWPPITGNQCNRIGKGYIYTQKVIKQYRTIVAFEIGKQLGDEVKPYLPLRGKIDVEIVPTAPDGTGARRDKDNLVKPVLDAITKAGLWDDDNQVANLFIYDYTDHDPENPRLMVKLKIRDLKRQRAKGSMTISQT